MAQNLLSLNFNQSPEYILFTKISPEHILFTKILKSKNFFWVPFGSFLVNLSLRESGVPTKFC